MGDVSTKALHVSIITLSERVRAGVRANIGGNKVVMPAPIATALKKYAHGLEMAICSCAELGRVLIANLLTVPKAPSKSHRPFFLPSRTPWLFCNRRLFISERALYPPTLKASTHGKPLAKQWTMPMKNSSCQHYLVDFFAKRLYIVLKTEGFTKT